jgi:hypothetical protein
MQKKRSETPTRGSHQNKLERQRGRSSPEVNLLTSPASFLAAMFDLFFDRPTPRRISIYSIEPEKDSQIALGMMESKQNSKNLIKQQISKIERRLISNRHEIRRKF